MNFENFYDMGVGQNYPSSSENQERVDVISVAQLNRYVAQVLDQQVPLVWIRGEISNFTAAASGHWYLSLKDDHAAVKAVMFRGRAMSVDFRPQNGMEVEVLGRVTLYEPRGDYQIQIEKMRRSGLGNLHEAFLRTKEKLAKEGLFDAQRKKTLPFFVKTVGVVTSLGAAALHDVLSAIARRAPYINIIVYPSLVQGKDAPASLIQALQQAQARQEVDVVLLVRGGGSIEDLWAFNDEALARVIADFSLPIISGVGHETDFTIADFVADVRAPTPTAAAEMVSVTTEQWQNLLSQHLHYLSKAIARQLQTLSIQVDKASHRLVSPQQRLQQFVQHQQFLQLRLQRRMEQVLQEREAQLSQEIRRLKGLSQRILPPLSLIEQLQAHLNRAMPKYLSQKRRALDAQTSALQAYNPRAILKRGYSITYDEQSHIVRQSGDVQAGHKLRIELANGSLDVMVLGEQK